MCVILLCGAALRVPLLARDARFTVDEALYATFARHVADGDLLLSGIALDKPPLLFWAIGGSFRIFGVSEFAARLPNLGASVLTLAALFALARRLYDQRVALVSTLLLAVSPFDRAFAATAYTDPLLTLTVIGGCLAATSARWRLAGLALAAAFATKPSAVQWFPLAILLGLAAHSATYPTWRASIRSLRQMGIGFTIGFVPLVMWSAARATVPDFWTLNVYNNSPGRLIRANELVPRLLRWSALLNTLAPLPGLGWLSVPLGKWIRRSHEPTRETLIDLILTAYSIATLAALWLIAFNTYDRYLHTLTPFALMLLARVYLAVSTWRAQEITTHFGRKNSVKTRAALSVALACSAAFLSPLLSSAIDSASDSSQFIGIDHVAAALNHLPESTIVYDHWLGWELGYYLGEAPSAQVIWQPSMNALLHAAALQPGYFVAPRAEVQPWLDGLTEAGLSLDVQRVDSGFVIVRVGPCLKNRC